MGIVVRQLGYNEEVELDLGSKFEERVQILYRMWRHCALDLTHLFRRWKTFGGNVHIVAPPYSRFSLWNNIKGPSYLPQNSNYHLFKAGIEPKWEDPQNKNGGKWIFVCKSGRDLNDMWLGLVRNQQISNLLKGVTINRQLL